MVKFFNFIKYFLPICYSALIIHPHLLNKKSLKYLGKPINTTPRKEPVLFLIKPLLLI